MKFTDRQVEMAWEEYKLIENNIVKFDRIIFTIKILSIIISLILFTIYLIKPAGSSAEYEILLYCNIISAFLFWCLNYFYKHVQNFPITRDRLLEEFINNTEKYKHYRIPNHTFLYNSLTDDERKILTKRGFKLGKNNKFKQKLFNFNSFLHFDTSLLYLFLIACTVIFIVLF
jgi:hypothetical protein